jgi:hypothetical protein
MVTSTDIRELIGRQAEPAPARSARVDRAQPFVDPRDEVYELRRLAADARRRADQLHANRALIASDRWHVLGRRLEHAAWELDRELRRSRPTR